MDKIILKDNGLNSGIRIDKYISEIKSELTRTYIQELIQNGNILVNGKTVKTSYKVNGDDEIQINIPESKPLEVIAQDMSLDIVYEDSDIIMINKPKGMVVHPAHGNYDNTLVNGILAHCKDNLSGINGVIRPGIVHRIDKDTTGILVIAKNDKAHQSLAEQFKQHTINRIYVALVKGNIEETEGTVDMPIARSKVDRKKMATDSNGKRAVTHFKVIERFNGYTLLELKLETGRTHQIRVHMSQIKHPLIGDDTYSSGKNEFGIKGQLLHAKTLGIIHPTTEEYIEFSVPIHEEFQNVLEKLREGEYDG